ncbi:peroxisomal membrane protein PEX14 isoform X1, partial [Tachysurus ichikawai]
KYILPLIMGSKEDKKHLQRIESSIVDMSGTLTQTDTNSRQTTTGSSRSPDPKQSISMLNSASLRHHQMRIFPETLNVLMLQEKSFSPVVRKSWV